MLVNWHLDWTCKISLPLFDISFQIPILQKLCVLQKGCEETDKRIFIKFYLWFETKKCNVESIHFDNCFTIKTLVPTLCHSSGSHSCGCFWLIIYLLIHRAHGAGLLTSCTCHTTVTSEITWHGIIGKLQFLKKLLNICSKIFSKLVNNAEAIITY